MYTADDMLEVYEKWPDMFQPLSFEFDVKAYDKAYCCGYGSSYIPILMAKELYGKDRVVPLRPGEMPTKELSGKALVVVSHSGNTFEAIKCVEEGQRSGMDVFIVSGGGKLIELCGGNVKCLRINQEKTTRLGFPYIMSGLTPLLDKLFNEKVTDRVKQYFAKLKGKEQELGEEAKKIAEFLSGSFLAGIYYSANAEPLALRFRYLLSENAKLHSVYEDIMEVAHDGITAWEMYYSMPIVFLRSQKDSEIQRERFEAIGEVLRALGHRVFEVNVGSEEDLFFKLYSLDVSTVFLSILRNVNPFITRSQEAIRKKVDLKHE